MTQIVNAAFRFDVDQNVSIEGDLLFSLTSREQKA